MEKITVTTLYDKPELFSEAISIVENEFNYSKDCKFTTDFYPLTQKENHKNNYVLYDNDAKKVVGHIGTLKKTLKIGNTLFPVTLIGGVAIDKEYQGKGLFKKLFSFIENDITSSTTFYLLWSNLDKFYNNFDFHLAFGTYQIKKINPNNFSSPYKKYKYKNLPQNLKESIQSLYIKNISNNLLTFVRSESDWKSFEEITSSDLYIKIKDDHIESYFFVNKGEDLHNIVYEISHLNITDLVLEEIPFQDIWIPEIGLCKTLKNCSISLNYQGLLKIGNPKIFSKFIETYSKNQIIIQEISKETISFIFNSKKYDYSISEFLPSILGPNPVDEFKPFFKPFFVSGLESV